MKAGSSPSKKYKILAVDDEIHSLGLLKRTFRKEFEVLPFTDPFEALDLLKVEGDDIAVVMCDQRMPKVSGIEVLRQAKISAPNSIRIMLTAYIDENIIMECINICEAYGYLVKPFDTSELIQTIKEALLTRERALVHKNIIKDLSELLIGTIEAICEALDEKDEYTNGHSNRVTLYSLLIGKEMGLPQAHLDKLRFAGLLHDIGKIGTPESILNKPGKLTDDEFAIIKMHPNRGAKIIENIKQLEDVVEWVRLHHERYDGRGYPDRLIGDQIPIEAAILAVADTYDAMTSDRSYRKGLPHQVAVDEIKKCTGSQFNPVVAEAFLKIEKEVEEHLKHKDNGRKVHLNSIIFDSKSVSEESETTVSI